MWIRSPGERTAQIDHGKQIIRMFNYNKSHGVMSDYCTSYEAARYLVVVVLRGTLLHGDFTHSVHIFGPFAGPLYAECSIEAKARIERLATLADQNKSRLETGQPMLYNDSGCDDDPDEHDESPVGASRCEHLQMTRAVVRDLSNQVLISATSVDAVLPLATQCGRLRPTRRFWRLANEANSGQFTRTGSTSRE